MTKQKLATLFKPQTKRDRASVAYIGNDGSVVVLFERDSPLGRQRYAHVAIGALTLALRGTTRSTSLATELSRIVIHDVGLLAVACTSGKPVHIDIYPDNSSENSRARGIKIQSLYIRVEGIGWFTVNEVPGVISGAFCLQGPGVSDIIGRTVDPMNAETLRANKGWLWSDVRILRFDDSQTEVTTQEDATSATTLQ